MSAPEKVVNIELARTERAAAIEEAKKQRRASQRKLLYETYARPILPELACLQIGHCKVGLAAAAFLQQLWFWARKKQAKKSPQQTIDDIWVYNGPEEWKVDLPYLSTRTIRRAAAKLKRLGFIDIDHTRKVQGSRVMHFRINLKWFDDNLREALEQQARARREQRKTIAAQRRFHGTLRDRSLGC
jgi:hypothetical protein